MRVLLTGWLLVMVTLAVVAVVSANWYEYGPPADSVDEDQQMLSRGWEPVPYQGGIWFFRRPRLYLPR